MNLKKITEGKKPGFYVSVAMSFLCLLTAIVYICCYQSEVDYHIINYWAFAFMLIGAIAGLAMLVFKLEKFVPYVVAGFSFLGLLFFIYGIYYYASVVFVDIDLHGFTAKDITCFILFIGTTVLGIVDIFLPQSVKKETITTESEVTE